MFREYRTNVAKTPLLDSKPDGRCVGNEDRDRINKFPQRLRHFVRDIDNDNVTAFDICQAFLLVERFKFEAEYSTTNLFYNFDYNTNPAKIIEDCIGFCKKGLRDIGFLNINEAAVEEIVRKNAVKNYKKAERAMIACDYVIEAFSALIFDERLTGTQTHAIEFAKKFYI